MPHSYFCASSQTKGLERGWKRRVRLGRDEINHRVYQIHKEGGVVNIFLTARRHLERTHSMENSLRTADAFPVVSIFRRERSDDRKCICCSQAVWKTDSRFFFSRLTRPCALRTLKTLTPRFTDFFTDFEKKTVILRKKPTVLQSTQSKARVDLSRSKITLKFIYMQDCRF